MPRKETIFLTWFREYKMRLSEGPEALLVVALAFSSFTVALARRSFTIRGTMRLASAVFPGNAKFGSARTLTTSIPQFPAPPGT